MVLKNKHIKKVCISHMTVHRASDKHVTVNCCITNHDDLSLDQTTYLYHIKLAMGISINILDAIFGGVVLSTR